MTLRAIWVISANVLLGACASDSITDTSPMTGSMISMFSIKSWDGALHCVGDSDDLIFLCNTTERGRLELSLDGNGDITSAQARFSNGRVRNVNLRPHVVYGLKYEKLKYAGLSGSSSTSYPGNCPTDERYDSAGRRCGERSAASRPGGY